MEVKIISATRESAAACLKREFPLTYQALVPDWFDEDSFGLTRFIKKHGNGTTCTMAVNDAGYLLRVMFTFELTAERLYPQKEFTREEIDRAAAWEIKYQKRHGRQFFRPAQALGKCLMNFLRERPEKLYEVTR